MQHKSVALVTGANKGIGPQMRAGLAPATRPTILKEGNRLGGEILATSIVLAAVKGVSRCFWAAYTWLLGLFTAAPMRDVESRCIPSVAFTPSGPLVYQWQDARCL